MHPKEGAPQVKHVLRVKRRGPPAALADSGGPKHIKQPKINLKDEGTRKKPLGSPCKTTDHNQAPPSELLPPPAAKQNHKLETWDKGEDIEVPLQTRVHLRQTDSEVGMELSD